MNKHSIADDQRLKVKTLPGGNSLKGTGHFVEPTIVDGLPRDHRINKEELFVPILSIVLVDGLEDAIQVANQTDYGLTAGIFSREPAEILDSSRKSKRASCTRTGPRAPRRARSSACSPLAVGRCPESRGSPRVAITISPSSSENRANRSIHNG